MHWEKSGKYKKKKQKAQLEELQSALLKAWTE